MELLNSSICQIQINGVKHFLDPNKTYRTDQFYTDYKHSEIESDFSKINLTLHVKEALTLNRVEIILDLSKEPLKAMLCNGFQTWTGSKYYSPDEEIPSLSKIARPFFKYYGDYYLNSPYIGKQYLHSWTYTRLQNNNTAQEIFIGSNNDQLAFTLFSYCKKTNKLVITKELNNFKIKHSFSLFDLIIGFDSSIHNTSPWNNHNLYPNTRPKPQLDSAWTSWYKYQQDINANILCRELDQIKEDDRPDLFQIDDGYQNYIGDWLDFKDDLKAELKNISAKIKEKNMAAGIWLAPFVVEPKSTLFKKHPDWIIKDSNGKPLKMGYNGVWKCWYYGLDIYKQDVQNYISKVFHVLKNDYGFNFFKVDFLFAASIHPPEGTSKAQAMTFGMELLKRAAKGATLLSCGVPLAASFGIADLSRVGPDTHLKWDFKLLKRLNKRERPSNFLALHTIICRFALRQFSALDPDVYLLRSNNKKEGLLLSFDQKRTHLIIASLFGDVQFTSDTTALYTEEQRSVLNEARALKNSRVLRLNRLSNDCYRVHTEAAILFINLNDASKKISFKGNLFTLEAYATKIIYTDQ